MNDQSVATPSDSTIDSAASPAEIRAALAKVLASAEFAASPQMCAFLTYVVEAHLAGEDHLLKGQNIGSAVLGRPVDFDSQRDPIVRVEANRLRRTLGVYYESHGSEDPIRFVIDRGSYVPRFEPAGTPRPVPEAEAVSSSVDAAAPAGPIGPPLSAVAATAPLWRGRLALVILAVAIASIAIALIGAFTRTGIRSEAPPPPVAASAIVDEPYLPSVEVMPFVIHAPGEVAERGRELVSTLTVALARFPELRVFARGGAKADFRLDGEITQDDAKSNVAMRLSATDTAAVIWSADVALTPEERANGIGIDRLVAVATTAVAPQFGAIAQYLAREQVGSDTGTLADYDCMISAQMQHYRFNDDRWPRLDACLREMIERYPNFATAAASRALLFIEEFRLDPDNAAALAALAEADVLARRALQLEPANVRAMTATAAAAFGKGDLEVARNMGLRAISANPLDPLSRSQYVLALLVSGYFDQALAQSAIARRIDPAHASIYDSLDYLAHFGIGTEPNPLHDAVTVDAPLLPFGLIARILAYDRDGQIAARDQARSALYDVMPLFAKDMPAALHQQFPVSPFTERIEAALRKAGVGSGMVDR